MKNTIALLVLVSIFKKGESVVTVWSKPVISSAEGSGTLSERINDGVSTGDTGITITATASNPIEYAKVSQTPTSPTLAIDSSSGDVTVSAGTVEYSSVTSFTLIVSASDGTDNTVKTATVTLLVNAAPLFSSHSSSPCIANGSVAGTDLIDLAATDANSDTITYTITSGNTNNDFTITTTGTVEVDTGKTLNMTATNSYTLVITAADDSSTPLTATTTVTATVSTTCSAGADSGAAAMALTFMTLLSALIISLQ